MKKLNRRNIRKMLTQMLSEASEFGDMKTSNTYTYKNDGYTYLVMDDMWYVIKDKKKSASSTKDYISLENNGTALNRLDKEHPDAREDKSSRKSLNGSFDDFKKWVDDDHERNTAFSNKEKQIIGKTYTSIKSSIKEIRKMLVMKPKEGSSFVFMIDHDPAKGEDFLNRINNTIKKIEECIAANDIQNLTEMTELLNRYSDDIQKKVTSTPLDAKKLRNVMINLAQSISSLREYSYPSGSSNVAKSIKEAVFNRLKKKIILEQTSDFNVTTAGTGEKFNGELKIGDETYNVDDDYVYSSSGHQLARIDLYKQFSIGGIKYFINDGNVYDVSKGTNTVMGTFEKDETADFKFKEEPNNPIVVDPKTGEQDVAKIKTNSNVECIQKIVDPYEIHTKHDGNWGKNTQKAWEMYIKGENTVLGKKSEYSDDERKMQTDQDGDGKTEVFKPNFDRKFKQTFPNVATSEMEILKKDLLKNTSVLTKLGYQKGAKHVCQFLKDINTKSVIKDRVGDLELDQSGMNESLSRGSLYRRRYHGRY